jgi:SAM-dependent methyltransferase
MSELTPVAKAGRRGRRVALIGGIALALAVLGLVGYAQLEQIHRFPPQQLTLEPVQAEGLILDIGGGGEGVIGQLNGSQVIAIDIDERELLDAPPGPLKLVMDARKLTFVPDSFNTTTVFFTFMYIKGPDHETVLQQIRRVLKPGGRLLIWDVNFRDRPPAKKYALFRYTAQLPGKQVSSGYGVSWPEGVQDLGYWVALGEKVGFEAGVKKDAGVWFYLELTKPRS